MNSVDWTLLRFFLAVAETGYLAAGARRIGATRPTLGWHIRDLEQAPGITPFRRSVRGLEPTDAVLGLIGDARAMDRAADTLVLKARKRISR